MRIWDIHPGYLNRLSLLGEHRELHGIVSILSRGKKGYSRHPETLRWVGLEPALAARHRQLRCEMLLRGFNERSPVDAGAGDPDGPAVFPETFIDPPGRQFSLLSGKYRDREMGRIPLPKNAQQLWGHHKYSVLAREPGLYRQIGPDTAHNRVDFDTLALVLVQALRKPPGPGGVRNALQHMWGHVSAANDPAGPAVGRMPLKELLRTIQERTLETGEPYLKTSTALSDLMVWL